MPALDQKIAESNRAGEAHRVGDARRALGRLTWVGRRGVAQRVLPESDPVARKSSSKSSRAEGPVSPTQYFTKLETAANAFVAASGVGSIAIEGPSWSRPMDRPERSALRAVSSDHVGSSKGRAGRQ